VNVGGLSHGGGERLAAGTLLHFYIVYDRALLTEWNNPVHIRACDGFSFLF